MNTSACCGMILGNSASSQIHFKSRSMIFMWSTVNMTLGAYSTFSLLRRLRNPDLTNIRRFILTLTASILMASGLWSSQLITYRGWTPPVDDLNQGPLQLQPGFIVLSFFAPVGLIFTAYALLYFKLGYKVLPWSCGLCGTLVGLSAGIIHFSLFLPLSSHNVTFNHTLVTISFLVAIFVSLFTHFTVVLQRTEHYRLWVLWCISPVFGGLITISVYVLQTAMTLIPSQYNELSGRSGKDNGITTLLPSTVITVALICTCISVYYLDHLEVRYDHISSPHLCIASIAFYDDGSLLASEEETLPIKTIDMTGIPKDILQDPDVRRDIYYWLLSISLDWSIIEPYISLISQDSASPKRCQHLCPLDLSILHRRYTGHSIIPQVQVRSIDLLKIRLLEAAARLAVELNISLTSIGILYERTLEIPAPRDTLSCSIHPLGPPVACRDAEEAIKCSLNSGIMLLFVRRVPFPPLDMASRFQTEDNRPRRFGPQSSRPHFMRRFRDTLAEITGLNETNIENMFCNCREFATKGLRPILEPGQTYVSIFAERWSPDEKTEVLVYDFAKHQIPSYRLDLPEFTPKMRRWLRDMSGFTVSDLIYICQRDVRQSQAYHRVKRSNRTNEDCEYDSMIEFKKVFAVALIQLMRDVSFIGDDLPTWTQLTANILDVPSTDSEGSMAHMIVLHCQEGRLTGSGEDGSDFSHPTESYGHLIPSISSHSPRMPFVFTYIPRDMYDRQYSLVTSPVAQEAYREEAIRELEQILYTGSHTRKGRTDIFKRSATRSRDQQSRSMTLVSSFSVESLNECGGQSSAKQLVQNGWSNLKDRARTLKTRLSRKQLRNVHERELVQIPSLPYPNALSSSSTATPSSESTRTMASSSNSSSKPMQLLSSSDRRRYMRSANDVNVIKSNNEELAAPSLLLFERNFRPSSRNQAKPIPESNNRNSFNRNKSHQQHGDDAQYPFLRVPPSSFTFSDRPYSRPISSYASYSVPNVNESRF